MSISRLITKAIIKLSRPSKYKKLFSHSQLAFMHDNSEMSSDTTWWWWCLILRSLVDLHVLAQTKNSLSRQVLLRFVPITLTNYQHVIEPFDVAAFVICSIENPTTFATFASLVRSISHSRSAFRQWIFKIENRISRALEKQIELTLWHFFLSQSHIS